MAVSLVVGSVTNSLLICSRQKREHFYFFSKHNSEQMYNILSREWLLYPHTDGQVTGTKERPFEVTGGQAIRLEDVCSGSQVFQVKGHRMLTGALYSANIPPLFLSSYIYTV